MIAIRPHHWAIAALIPTALAGHYALTPMCTAPTCESAPVAMDTPATISAIGSPVRQQPPRPIEDVILEEGGARQAPEQAQAPAERARSGPSWSWRWSARSLRRSDSQAPTPRIIVEPHGQLRLMPAPRGQVDVPTLSWHRRGGGEVWDFVPIETRKRLEALNAQLDLEQGARADMLVEQGVAYLAYQPMARHHDRAGLELYAVELEHGTPVWRNLLAPFQLEAAGGDVQINRVHMERRGQRLEVFVYGDGSPRRHELDVRSGRLLETEEMSARWSQLDTELARAPARPGARRVELSTKGSVSAFTYQEGLRRQVEDVLTVERRRDGELAWRLNLAGDAIAPVELPPELTFVDLGVFIAASYEYDRGGVILTALDLETGEVRWTKRARGLGHSGPVDRNHVRLALRPMHGTSSGFGVVVLGQERGRGSYQEIFALQDGRTLSSIQFGPQVRLDGSIDLIQSVQ